MGKILRVRRLENIFDATLKYADPDRDLCQLSVPELKAPAIAFGSAKKLKVGQRVYAIGTPKGLELTLSEGLVSSLRQYEGSQYIQTSAAISPGSSGGGLFDDQGRLVGITTFQVIDGQNLNFALPVEWISELPNRSQNTASESNKNTLYWLNQMIAIQKKKNWKELLKLSQQWLKKEAGNAFAWYSMGSAYAELKKYDEAIKSYRKALSIEPESASFWNDLGLAYAKSKQYSKAIDAFRESIRIEPEYDDTWHNLGITYANLKEYEQAIQAYREALRIQPDSAKTWFSLANVYDNLKQIDQAIYAYLEAIRIQPDHAGAWNNLGITYYQQGRSDKVREIYKTLLKLDQAMAERYFNALILP